MNTHAEKCPLCFGTGELREGFRKRKCNGCFGKGWVVVNDEVKNASNNK